MQLVKGVTKFVVALVVTAVAANVATAPTATASGLTSERPFRADGYVYECDDGGGFRLCIFYWYNEREVSARVHYNEGGGPARDMVLKIVTEETRDNGKPKWARTKHCGTMHVGEYCRLAKSPRPAMEYKAGLFFSGHWIGAVGIDP